MTTLPRLILILFLAGCGARTEPFQAAPRPDAPSYTSAVPAGGTRYSNDSIADVFVRLTHDLEWGGSRPNLVRFEGPVTVALTGAGAQQYQGFLTAFLADLADRTNIPITATEGPASILIRLVPGAEYAIYDQNQCFVIMDQPDWKTFLESDVAGGNQFEERTSQSLLSVIIPNTAEPYNIRECIIEEITQALGPANDLYSLSNSIFNDDNAHTWPTALDYLVLRVLYDPDMRTGLNRDETREKARTILHRVNPDGRQAPDLPEVLQDRFFEWREVLHRLPDDPEEKERTLSQTRALINKARNTAPGSAYHCTALGVDASIRRQVKTDDALDVIDLAIDVCAQLHGPNDVRIALLRLDRAYMLFHLGRYRDAVTEAEGLPETFISHGRDGSVAAAYIVQWAARTLRDRTDSAEKQRESAGAWAAYAFGSDNDILETFR
ncbi:MAG: DUF2927 domain-containing protein [Pseudomonadota bacterium]